MPNAVLTIQREYSSLCFRCNETQRYSTFPLYDITHIPINSLQPLMYIDYVLE